MPLRKDDRTRSHAKQLTSGRCHDSADDSLTVSRPAARRRIDRRMDRQMAVRSATADTVADDLVVKFPHRPGVKAKTYDFGSLGIPLDIAAMLAHAARYYPIPLAYLSQRTRWHNITIFSRFVREDPQMRSAADVNTAMINRYRKWLDLQTDSRTGDPWAQKTKADAMLALRSMINRAKAICPHRLPSPIIFPAHCYPRREPPQPRRRLNKEELNTLTWCYREEIAEIRARFKMSQQILRGESSARQDPHLAEILVALNRLNNTGFPTAVAMKAELLKTGIKYETVTERGGLQRLQSFLFLTSDSAAPFFIALLMQLAGNVEPVRLLARDCIRPGWTDDQDVTIVWEKARSGRAPQRTQKRSFPPNERYAAPALITDLLALTEPMASRVAESDQNRLFLAWNGYKKTFNVITYEALVPAAQRFLSRAAERIEEWNRKHPNRKKPLLPDFQLRDLRGSIAAEVYNSPGGNIRRARRILNHASPDTTESYIEGPLTQDRDYRIMTSLIESWVDNLCSHRAAPGHSTPSGGEAVPPAASFGNDCRDPMIPSTSGGPRLCPHFQQCLDCPGLVIHIDAKHYALLLRAEATFESARQRLHHARWQLLYADTYRRLKGILEQFPKSLLPEAQRLLASMSPLPKLE